MLSEACMHVFFFLFALADLSQKKNLPLLGSLGTPNAGEKNEKYESFNEGGGRINHQSQKIFLNRFFSD